jgi:hypothetical protein
VQVSGAVEVNVIFFFLDDPDMPVLTARMWVIGLFLIMIAGCVLFQCHLATRARAPFLPHGQILRLNAPDQDLSNPPPTTSLADQHLSQPGAVEHQGARTGAYHGQRGRRFLVWPASMVWPRNLVASALFNMLHAEDNENQSGMSRYRYFVIVAAGATERLFCVGSHRTTCSTNSLESRMGRG